MEQRLPFTDAIREFWAMRQRQSEANRGDQGRRTETTGGNHMNGFLVTIRRRLLDAGVPSDCIYTGRSLNVIPGYFRATKSFDLLVVREGQLRVVVELKSQVGSFGNNFNNRVEEVIGSATDLWTAYREGAFGSTTPWMGYLMLLEDCEKSNTPVISSSRHFDIFPEFNGASYTKRYEILCTKLLTERLYSGVALLLASQAAAANDANYRELSPALGADRFLRALVNAAV